MVHTLLVIAGNICKHNHEGLFWIALIAYAGNRSALMVCLEILVTENYTGVCGKYLAGYCWKYLPT